MEGWGLSWQASLNKAKEMAAAVQESASATASAIDWQAAAQKAKDLGNQLQENTNKVANQLQENTKVLAERAQAMSNPITEQARQKLAELHINESLVTLEERLNDLNSKISTEAQKEEISQEELLAFGITPDYQDFVRSLNYSTFRDFPEEHLQPLDDGGEGSGSGSKSLSPWQARHATLVVQSVKEMNELRFVLCPRRMTDERFWAVYFSLAKKHLPRKAYDPSTPAPEFERRQLVPEPSAGVSVDSAKAALDAEPG